VSILLVAIIATLASADVLCLLPCEVAAGTTHHDSAAVPAPGHCGSATPSGTGETTVAAAAESCAGQHAWVSPAADRTVSRTPIEPAVTGLFFARADSIACPVDGITSAALEHPPGAPARSATPLRI
jgi:hypothetical protein